MYTTECYAYAYVIIQTLRVNTILFVSTILIYFNIIRTVEHIPEAQRLLIVPQIQVHNICVSISHRIISIAAIKWATQPI